MTIERILQLIIFVALVLVVQPAESDCRDRFASCFAGDRYRDCILHLRAILGQQTQVADSAVQRPSTSTLGLHTCGDTFLRATFPDGEGIWDG